MARKNVSEHRETIRRLFDADKNAGKRLEDARQQAGSMVEDARRKADDLVEQARTDAESEAEAIVREAEEKAARAAQTSGASDQIHAMRRQARENMDRAVEFLVGWVIAKSGY